MDSSIREAMIILLVVIATFSVTVIVLRRKAKRNKPQE